MALWNHSHLQGLSAAGCLRAWTGGSLPERLSVIGPQERTTVRAFFREQLADWHTAWGDLPDADTLRVFWKRARFDAHATHRDFLPCQFGAL